MDKYKLDDNCLKHHFGDDDAECTCTPEQIKQREDFFSALERWDEENREQFKEHMAEFIERQQVKNAKQVEKLEQVATLYDPMTFVLEPYERQVLTMWETQHNKTCRMKWNEDGTRILFPGGAAGGTLTYKFTPTGIGMAIYVSCSCGEEINLTDYESW